MLGSEVFGGLCVCVLFCIVGYKLETAFNSVAQAGIPPALASQVQG